MRPSDFDICECGDYRHQHKDGRRCQMCLPKDSYTGGQCYFFRLHLVMQPPVWRRAS